MSEEYLNCPHCFAVQPACNLKCALCGEIMRQEASVEKGFIIRNYRLIKDGLIVSAILLIAAQILLPAPYNPAYIYKRILYNPTFLCGDGVYSFASTSSGACSGHNGIVKIYRDALIEKRKERIETREQNK